MSPVVTLLWSVDAFICAVSRDLGIYFSGSTMENRLGNTRITLIMTIPIFVLWPGEREKMYAGVTS